VLLADRRDSVAAYMERASDFADQVAPGEFVYDSLPNAKQAAVGVMALWLGITSLFVI